MLWNSWPSWSSAVEVTGPGPEKSGLGLELAPRAADSAFRDVRSVVEAVVTTLKKKYKLL